MVKSERGAWLFDGEEWREDKRKDGKIFSVRVRNIVIVRGLLVPLQITSHQILGHSSARDQARR